MYTVLPSPLLQRISGLRFQPLVDLHSGQVFAHEVLVEIHNVNLEVLFASLPSRSALQIFFWQANTLLTFRQNTFSTNALSGCCWRYAISSG